MNLRIPFSAAIGILFLPSICMAQDTPSTVSIDMIWIMNALLFLIGCFLVFFMVCRFAMLEAGLVVPRM